MAITVACRCGKQLRAKDEIAGKRVKCPACGNILSVPTSQPLPTGIQGPRVDVGIELDGPSLGRKDSSTDHQDNSGPPPIPQAEWYYASDGQQHGPVTLLALKQLVESGQLAPTDLAWQLGTSEWKPVAAAIQLGTADAQTSSGKGQVVSSSKGIGAGQGTAAPPKPKESSSGLGIFVGIGVLAVLAAIALLIYIQPSDTTDVSGTISSSYEAAPTYNPPADATLPTGSSIQPQTEDPQQQAAEQLKNFAKEIHSEIKNLVDGHKLYSSEEAYDSVITITINPSYDYDIKESDSVLNPFRGEIYIGFEAEVTVEPKGMLKGMMQPQKGWTKDDPRIIKCEYKNMHWSLVDSEILYSADKFLALPKKGY